ncbi:MAG: hypothetical protein ACK4VI_01385 [Alphaproteobacteria bacterium]
MALPLIPIILGLIGVGGTAAHVATDGDSTRGLGRLGSEFMAAMAGGASEVALEPLMKMIFKDDELAAQVAASLSEGKFDEAFDAISNNWDKVNFEGMVGLVAGGYIANSVLSSVGVSGMTKFAILAPIAALAATATTRLWSAVQSGDVSLDNLGVGSIWSAVVAGNREGSEVDLSPARDPAPAAQAPVLEHEPS